MNAVLVAEAILASCDAAVARIANGSTPASERWRAVRELHDAYPDVWRNLDRARRELARRGANTASFDEERPAAPRTVVRPRETAAAAASELAPVSAVDRDALDAARRAIEQLKLALPGADWTDIGARTDAVGATILAKHGKPRLVVGIGAGVLAIAVMGGFVLAQPATHVHRTPAELAAARASELAVSLADVDAGRKANIAELQAEMSPSIACDTTKAHDLIRLLVLDGRNLDAKLFGDEYDAKCGDDAFIDHWAAAPKQHTRASDVQVVGYVHLHDGEHALVVDASGATTVGSETVAIDVPR